MSKPSFKETLELYYKFLQENVGDYNVTFYPENVSGVELVVEYSTYVRDGEYNYDVTYIKSRLDKEAAKLVSFFGYDEDRDWSDAIDVGEDMDSYLIILMNQLPDIWDELQGYDEYYDIEGNFDLDHIHENYSSFEEFWDEVESETDIGKTEIELNDEYNAVVGKGDEYVTVGCQSIHIDKIKAVVKAWEQAQK